MAAGKSASLADRTAICRKRAMYKPPSVPQLSAMFVGTDAEERRNWLVNPYVSSGGNWRVIAYTANVRLCALCQAWSVLKSLIAIRTVAHTSNNPPEVDVTVWA